MSRKIIITIIAGASLLLLTGLTGVAAKHFKCRPNPGNFHHTGFMAEAGLKDFEEILSLNPDQIEKIREIFKSHREQFKHGSRDISSADRRKAHSKIRAALYEQIMPILDETQQKILTGLKTDFEAGKIPDIIIETRVRRMTEDLDLTDSQAKELKSTFTEFGEKMISIRNSDDPQRGEMRKQFAEMHDQLEELGINQGRWYHRIYSVHGSRYHRSP